MMLKLLNKLWRRPIKSTKQEICKQIGEEGAQNPKQFWNLSYICYIYLCPDLVGTSIQLFFFSLRSDMY
ncbi:hypothetical protein Scep_014590 [Stephania cephalantha]|uniref:Uncharacterized protein n=1 Tax=Stephania cephalantha TaxID=152367 RepID=A0AAP0J1I9_9MAGN